MPILFSAMMQSRETDCTPAQVCGEIAESFGVRTTEVGLLRLEDRTLKFLFPVELQAAGSIPLSSSAVAARTAESRKAEIFNNFADVMHHTCFERIKIGDGPNDNSQTIQRLMSAPIIGAEGTVLGVLQISRKGVSPAAAGPNFDVQDLKTLETIASEVSRVIGSMMTDVSTCKHRLRFRP